MNIFYLHLIYKDWTFDLSNKSIWREQSFQNRKSKDMLSLKDISFIILILGPKSRRILNDYNAW